MAHHIDSRLAATPQITIAEIWNELKAQHGLAVGYSTVRGYPLSTGRRHVLRYRVWRAPTGISVELSGDAGITRS